MEDNNSKILNELKDYALEKEMHSDYEKRCQAFAKFIIENGCTQQGEDEEDV